MPSVERVISVLRGEAVHLRMARDGDLDELYELLSDLESRGLFFPVGMKSEPSLRAAFAKNGFWGEDQGMLLIIDAENRIVGEIEYFPIMDYLQGYEISYRLFGTQHAGKGYTTEAVNLLVAYLFGRKRVNRMELAIHPDNVASQRVAEKCGFTLEGLKRGCWFHQGEYHDLQVWSILRHEASAT